MTMSIPSIRSNGPNLSKLLLSEDPDDALDKRLQDYIIASLWSSKQIQESFAYFEYFKLECKTWRLSGSAVAIQTYQDFLDLVDHLKRNRNEKRSASAVLDFFPPIQPADEKTPLPEEESTLEQLQMPLRERFPYCDPASATNSIFLVVRLWLMLNVGSSAILSPFYGRSSPDWTEDQSLDTFIDACFPASEWGPRLSQWPYSLNAYNLQRIGGFEIIWTDHLADHLYLNEDLGTINIYHHVQVTRGLLHTRSPDQALPDRLIVETLQTLALLIPRANRDCKRWFESVHTKFAENIDQGAGDVELLHWARSPEKYKFWGQRLITIKMAYDDSEPKNLGQWWHDRRSKVQWYTFWGKYISESFLIGPNDAVSRTTCVELRNAYSLSCSVRRCVLQLQHQHRKSAADSQSRLVAILVLILTIVFGLIQSITGVMQVYYAAHTVPSK
jgi:hypothetical protein